MLLLLLLSDSLKGQGRVASASQLLIVPSSKSVSQQQVCLRERLQRLPSALLLLFVPRKAETRPQASTARTCRGNSHSPLCHTKESHSRVSAPLPRLETRERL